MAKRLNKKDKKAASAVLDAAFVKSMKSLADEMIALRFAQGMLNLKQKRKQKRSRA